jgi:hypothetical protein
MAEKVTGVNVEGRNYEFLAGQAVRGACTALAADWVKPVTLPEGTLLVDGLIVAVMFVNGTSVGWSGTKTVYSSDGENFFYDQAMTDPVTLPPPDCYNVSLISGDEYSLSCFPVIVYGSHRLPVCDSRGHYAGGALWAAGDTVAALYLDEKFMLLYSVVDEVKLGVSSPVSSNAVARDAVLKSEITNEVAVDNMYSVSSNAVAQYIPNSAHGITPTFSASGWVGEYGGNMFVRVARGSCFACGKLYIQFEAANVADRIEITIATGNTSYLRCYGLYATNSYFIRNVIFRNVDNSWNSDWELYIQLVPVYGCAIYVAKIAEYCQTIVPVVDSSSTSAPSNQQKNITLPNMGGFFSG